MKICGLCSHHMTLEACGSGSYWSKETGQVDLCHADDHSCYHQWTVYGKRPVHPTSLPWRQVAQALPEFVQWVVQHHGPIRGDELLTQERYYELKAEYERERT